MKRNIYIGLSNLLIVLILVGCASNEIKITPKSIANLMFKDIDTARIDRGTHAQLLKANELKTLQECITLGKNLEELDTNETPPTMSNEYLCISLTKQSRSEMDLFYNYKEGYMLVAKIQVNEEKENEYQRNLQLVKKYLNGLYKFYPSSQFKDLVDKLNKEDTQE